MLQPLHTRQFYDDPTDGNDDWWDSNSGYTVRYVITASIIVLFLAVIVIAYMHVSRRARQGRAPMWYSRWSPNSVQRQNQQMYPLPNGASWPSHGISSSANGPDGQYLQHPPPLYTHDNPPAYQPPPNATKAIPTQTIREIPASDDSQGNSHPQPHSPASVEPPPPSYASNR